MSSFRCEFCEVFPRPECQCYFNSVDYFVKILITWVSKLLKVAGKTIWLYHCLWKQIFNGL